VKPLVQITGTRKDTIMREVKSALASIRQPSVMRLEEVWRDTIRATGPKIVTCVTVTDRQFGQLKLIRRVCTDAEVDAARLIEWAIRKWPTLCYAAQTAKALQVCPMEPQINFLLAHCAVAINTMAQEEAKKAQPRRSSATAQPQPKARPELGGGAQPEQSIAEEAHPQQLAQPQAEPHAPHKMTTEELIQMLAELNE
jgi:hypothetical protein